jgi:hypothetical protein
VPQHEPGFWRCLCPWQILSAVDADQPRRVGQRRDFRQQRRLDVLARNEQLDRLDPRSCRRGNEILALRDEEPELVPPAAVVQLANELELLVFPGGDQVDCEARADFAFSAIAPNA